MGYGALIWAVGRCYGLWGAAMGTAMGYGGCYGLWGAAMGHCYGLLWGGYGVGWGCSRVLWGAPMGCCGIPMTPNRPIPFYGTPMTPM